ncbi:MAG: hypothetical protein GC206_10665 [Alphaproteobacteria bacterium]|nr:hypothetical protein [Alphaproteobacteria bacterium]
MRRLVLLLFAVLFVGSCTTTKHFMFSGDFQRPPANSLVLIVEPDIQLAIVMAGGTHEPREDWSSAAQRNVAESLSAHLNEQGHSTQRYNVDSAMAGRIGQVVRLHTTVGQSILGFNYGLFSLPTKEDNFDWTLGPGVQEIAAQTNAHYALFVSGNGSYASGGRVAVAVGLAILGVGVPLGEQQVFCSLVDLQTGNVLWFNVANAGPSADMRDPEGAASLVRTLMRSSPLQSATANE